MMIVLAAPQGRAHAVEVLDEPPSEDLTYDHGRLPAETHWWLVAGSLRVCQTAAINGGAPTWLSFS